MKDVSPELLKRIQDSFTAAVKQDAAISHVMEKVRNGKATYNEANEYAIRLGEHLAGAYKQITAEDLPDGRMYYNIAKSVVEPTMYQNYGMITDVTDQVQQALNREAGIGLNAITPELNQDRIDGILNRVSSEADFDDIRWILDDPIVVFCQSIIDDAIRDNAEFHYKAGMTPKIVRKSAWKCCKWCTQQEGTYEYPDVPDDVYRRHENCRCKVDYHPGNGKKQNVHSKVWKKGIDLIDYLNDEEKIKLKEKINREKRIRKQNGKYCYETTELWYKQEIKEKNQVIIRNDVYAKRKYFIEEKNKVIIPSEKSDEFRVAKVLIDNFGGKIELLPRISEPDGYKMADYIFRGELFDLKSVEGNHKHTLYGMVKSKKDQANNFIFDLSKSKLSTADALDQIENDIYRSTHTLFVKKIIVIRDNKIIKTFERI